jgi:hypothetical protein
MKNLIKATIAAITGLAIIITGTFAWKQILEEANEFIGDNTTVTIRDDFDPSINMKDVFVENTGNVTLFARVKLDEAMDLTNNKWRPAKGTGDWVTHKHGAIAIDCGNTNAAGKKFHDYFTWKMGGSKWYMPSDGSKTVIHDLNQYDDKTPGAKQTPDAAITTSAQFLAMTSDEQKAFIGWIFSTDGYAYWSQPLKKGEATGLLLHGVETLASLKGTEYYYAINVIVEVVDKSDIPMWTEGKEPQDGGSKHPQATPDGKEVIDIIVGNDKEVTTGKEIPIVKPAVFTPVTNPNAALGDGYYYKKDFNNPGNPALNEFFHAGSFHLEDVITDGNYSGVTIDAKDSMYKPYITIGTCDRHSGKPSIIYTYEPTKEEWRTVLTSDEMPIPVQVTLKRGADTADITLNLIYPGCGVTF